jgi:hypothetical protein
MLLSHENLRRDLATELDSIHNYYERPVFRELHTQLSDKFDNTEYVADIACVALNHLPPRYIRHDVDMAFYLSPIEREEMLVKIQIAVKNAIQFVDDRNAEHG